MKKISMRLTLRIDMTAEAGSMVMLDPAKALSHKNMLSASEIAECAAREPYTALEFIGKDLPPEVLAECAARAPVTALEIIGKDLPPEVAAWCMARTKR